MESIPVLKVLRHQEMKMVAPPTGWTACNPCSTGRFTNVTLIQKTNPYKTRNVDLSGELWLGEHTDLSNIRLCFYFNRVWFSGTTDSIHQVLGLVGFPAKLWHLSEGKETWLPFSQENRLQFLTLSNTKLKIYQWNFKGQKANLLQTVALSIPASWLGSTAPVLHQGSWFMLIHEENYIHRCLRLALKTFEPTGISGPFRLKNQDTPEIVTSILIDDESNLTIFWGNDATKCWATKISFESLPEISLSKTWESALQPAVLNPLQ